jgi:DNA-binding response OmpR family regulator
MILMAAAMAASSAPSRKPDLEIGRMELVSFCTFIVPFFTMFFNTVNTLVLGKRFWGKVSKEIQIAPSPPFWSNSPFVCSCSKMGRGVETLTAISHLLHTLRVWCGRGRSKMRILLIEDQADIAEFIQRGLEEEGHKITVAADGEIGLHLATDELFALILLDIMLPKRDGWSVCEALRRRQIATPILMLTARDAVQDRVRGLELGADDYLPKPFDFAELLARVHALLRRDRLHKGRHIQIADLELDTRLRRVTRAGTEIVLTDREYTLFEALATRPCQILSREFIQESVWQDEDSYSNTVDVHLGLLRKKIDSGREVKLLQTVYGQGYTLRVSNSETPGRNTP